MPTTPLSPPAIRLDHGRRRQAIVASLVREVVQGELRPGQHLVTQALARRFGVSHTPIREALIVLAGIGLVDLEPNRGAVVRRVTPRDVKEVCQVRRVLECEAVRAACGRIDPSALEGLRDELRRLLTLESRNAHRFIEEARALDSRLHDLIAASCGNALLARELDRLTLLFRAFRDAAWSYVEARNDYGRLEAEAREHLAIVEALLARDRSGAARTMARHIRAGLEEWSRALPSSGPNRPRDKTNGDIS